MKKKFTAASCILLLLVLSGCGNNSNVKSSDDVITIMAPLMGAEAPTDDNDFELMIEELTGHKIQMVWVPDSQYTDKFNVTMASNDIPNIVVAKDKSPAIYDFVDAGAYWQLDDYIGDYENLNVDETSSLNASFNGDTYGVYRPRDLIRSTVLINHQWLENLSLDIPLTLEDFTSMCDAFTNDDPDGNGENDTYCLSIPKWDGGLNTYSSFDMMEIWFGAPNAWGYVEAENKWMPDFMTEEYFTGLKYFKELYEKGYINQDFAVLPTDDWPAEFINGKAGVIVDTQSQASSNCNAMKELDGVTDDTDCSEYVDITNSIITDGKQYILPTTGFSGQLMMPKDSNDEESLLNCLDFLNKLASDEGNRLINSGVEGVDYTLDENNNPVATAEFPNQDFVTSYSKIAVAPTGRTTPQDTMQEKRYELQDEATSYMVNNQLESLFSTVYAENGANLEYIMSDARTQYIGGVIDDAGYQDAIDLWLSSGGQDYIDDMNKLAEEAGIEPETMY